MNDIDIAIVNWSEKQAEITSVRRVVFVEEQNVPESIDFDGSDPDYIHVLAYDNNGRPVGTARINRKGRIGRTAVLQNYRQQENDSGINGLRQEKFNHRLSFILPGQRGRILQKNGFRASRRRIPRSRNKTHQHEIGKITKITNSDILSPFGQDQAETAICSGSGTTCRRFLRRFIVRCSPQLTGVSLDATCRASTAFSAYKSASISCQRPSARLNKPPETRIRMSGQALMDFIVSINRRTFGACLGAVP